MQIFAKTFLLVFTIEIVNGELSNCANENLESKINEAHFSDFPDTNLTDLVKYAIKNYSDLNQNYDNKMNAIAKDIHFIKNLFHTRELQSFCDAGSNENGTKADPSLYDDLWVIIQRRQEGAVSFYRSWVHYVVGFGNLFREFFIGLDKIYYLTNSRPHQLLIKLENFKGKLEYALYDEFLIGNEGEKYQLKKLGSYSGNAGDYLRDHVGMYFSTRDRDNDASPYLHCAKLYQGGWWYNNCMTSNLNGPFRTRYELNNINITWGKNNVTQIKIVQMMLRPRLK